MNRKILLGSIVALALCASLCVVGILVLQLPGVMPGVSVSATSTTVARSASPTLVAPLGATPLPSISSTTADALVRTQIAPRDLYQIVPRLRKDLPLPAALPTPQPRARSVGEHDSFFVVENASTGKYRTVTATLQVITPNAYFWVEDGQEFDRSGLQKSADVFEQKTFPTNQKYFGDAGRGSDGETRIHILNTRFQDAAGYFSTEDSYPRTLVPFSNQRNIIYVDMHSTPPGNDRYNAVLSHEFQHLIHAVQATYKTGWIDEGMGDLAMKVNGYRVDATLQEFARNLDTQLNTWSMGQDAGAHYAAAYLFFNYTAERFGPDFIRSVIHAPHEGINGIQAVLDLRSPGTRFEDLFADWAVTNYLNDPSVENKRYSYSNESSFRVARVPSLTQYPVERTVPLHEYAASYLTLQPSTGDVTVYFTGTTAAKLLPVDAHGGKWMWYSNRADLANMTLTRQLDLSGVSRATLQFWTWYDIEPNYDYAYVEVSTDNGKTWDIQKGKYTTTENPNGASYGPAYTGKSGTGDNNAPAQWVQEQIDLSAFAGKKVLLRFEYITDDALNLPSWSIDDIAIPEINYSDSVENGEGGWQASGFIRTDNVLPQRYIVQIVQESASTQVIRIPLDSQNRGRLTINGFGKEVSRAVLVVVAYAPTTTEPTEFQVGVAPR